jgi:hypothetical protein
MHHAGVAIYWCLNIYANKLLKSVKINTALEYGCENMKIKKLLKIQLLIKF